MGLELVLPMGAKYIEVWKSYYYDLEVSPQGSAMRVVDLAPWFYPLLLY